MFRFPSLCLCFTNKKMGILISFQKLNHYNHLSNQYHFAVIIIHISNDYSLLSKSNASKTNFFFLLVALKISFKSALQCIKVSIVVSYSFKFCVSEFSFIFKSFKSLNFHSLAPNLFVI